MTILTISVPRINDQLSDFSTLASIWRQVMDAGDGAEVHFDFSHCDFLRPNAVVFLGGLARLMQQRGGVPRFLSGTMQNWVRTNLFQNGFAAAMGENVSSWQGNSIPFREDPWEDKTAIVDGYLKPLWLGRGWVNVSRLLTNAISGQMWEIYANAFGHGESPVGALSCGQYFPKRHELVLAVADFGVGIPSNARLHGNPNFTGKEAMEWAFYPGTTSIPHSTGTPRGMGLDLLREFIRVSQGVLAIYSHDGYARIDGSGEIYQNLPAFFEGTLVQVTLRCDDTYYSLSNEVDSAPYF